MRKLDHENVVNMHDVIDDVFANKLYMVIDYCKARRRRLDPAPAAAAWTLPRRAAPRRRKERRTLRRPARPAHPHVPRAPHARPPPVAAQHGAIMDSNEMPCSPLELSKSRKWFADAVVGLDYLHFQGVAHFDLKPDNILIGPDNTAVIADFGVSRIMKEDAHSVSGSPGTPTYTAPEAYGDVKYDPFLADVWSFGVTLHAMVFGSLPYMSQNQIELIELITAPSEWACAHTHADAEMMGLMRGMVRKDLAQRLTLTQVKEHPWVSGELAKRSGKSSYARDEWEKIEVDEEELRKAVIAGHVANFRKTPHGTLLKTTAAAEARTYKAFEAAKSPVARFLPELHDVKDSTRKRVIIEMSDLTHGVDQPCLMDIKMATRTFTEEDAASQEQRADLLAKMLKVNPDAATPAEAAAGGITKMRYLRFREGASTSATLGFRVDAVQLADGLEGVVPDSNELKSIDSVAAVNTAIRQYIQYRQPLAREFGLRLRELREALEGDDVFMSHSFVRTSVSSLLLACWALTAHLTLTFHPHLTSPLTSHLSPSPYPTPHPRPTPNQLLFVYSAVTCSCSVHLIDMSKVQKAARVLAHRGPWQPGNDEDGYLDGLDALIRSFEELSDEAPMAPPPGLSERKKSTGSVVASRA